MRTNEELNAVILKWMGWEKQEFGWKQYDSTGLRIDKRQDPPDYVGDLDEMHDAEKKLIFSKRESYIRNLRRILSAGLDDGLLVVELVFATARQRAEALVSVIEGEKK